MRTSRIPCDAHSSRYTGINSPTSDGRNVCRSSSPVIGSGTGASSDSNPADGELTTDSRGSSWLAALEETWVVAGQAASARWPGAAEFSVQLRARRPRDDVQAYRWNLEPFRPRAHHPSADGSRS